MSNYILAIDTSCDETSAAVTDGRRVLSNVISSQINLHKKYGGVFPALAKRAHEERIDYVIKEALKRASSVLSRSKKLSSQNSNFQIPNSKQFQISNFKFQIDAIAVTQGPGLAIALEVGIRKAKEIIKNLQLPLIAVNHLEGHIYSCLAQNIKGKEIPPLRPDVHRDFGRNDFKTSVIPSGAEGSLSPATFQFPALCLIVSGGHTQLTLMKDHGVYETIGQTLDDACGEALDKAARILKLGYPGGPVIERLAEKYCHPEALPKDPVGILRCAQNDKVFHFNQSLPQKSNLNFSYSGLKTQLLYLVQSLAENEFNASLRELASSFQEACFEQLIRKTSQVIKIYQPKSLVCGGGVIANKRLRKLLRDLAKKNSLPVYFPQNKKLITDNAAMIGVAAYYHFLRNDFVEDPETLDREPRLSL